MIGLLGYRFRRIECDQRVKYSYIFMDGDGMVYAYTQASATVWMGGGVNWGLTNYRIGSGARVKINLLSGSQAIRFE